MAVNVLSTLDYVVFGIVLLLSTSIGVYYAWKDRKAKDSRQYLTADGQMGIFPVSMSLIASYISSQQILGLPSETYTHGTVFWSSHVWIVFGIAVTHFVFLPMFYKANFTSANKYFLRRFNSNALRMMASCIAGTSLMFFMGIVLYGPALAISSVTDFSIWTTVLTVGIICTFYTTIGGLKAVILTDTIQLLIMVAGLMAVLIKISVDMGGIGEIWKLSSEGGRIGYSFDFNAFHAVPNFYDSMLYGIIYWCSVMSVTQTSVQRYCSMATLKEAKIILFLNFPGINLTAGLAALCGLALYANYRDCDPIKAGKITSSDQIMPYYVLEYLNYAGIPGLFIACVFSSSLSTLSSGYTSLSAIVWGDFLKPLLKFTGKKEVYTTKLIAAGFGVISIAIAYLCSNVESIIQAQAILGSPFLTALFGVYIAATCVPFVNRRGALTGIMFGLVWCFTIGIGSITVKKAHTFLPSSIEGCIFNSSIADFNTTSVDLTTKMHSSIPSGFNKIFHLSPYMMPPLAFFVTFGCTVLASAVTGGATNEPPVDPEYIFKPILRLSSIKLPQKLRRFLCPRILVNKEEDKKKYVLQMKTASTETVVSESNNTRF